MHSRRPVLKRYKEYARTSKNIFHFTIIFLLPTMLEKILAEVLLHASKALFITNHCLLPLPLGEK